uniref:1-deoxy-D-xylulose 5-phosphate reductoisomerase, apicoplastic n=1 Tax=Eucampia antarctica TaxID=49252 RepID=A0A7S2R5M5_9STRA|mmetsp:Transcript_17239/g.16699  ORF Transcript_17239/g.16699 Transcript_17239/m.16699 type:complete len:483 (+) Transcript_17239:40-1488(+)|eukprot:CAMPEP_0197833372 /NCGR_PEP_ID=MMETSP1437-20131217/18824_1 /TAXON_ID=49252 ORGANISM="Eucampia antarctica, Strain CCMP1452" /NCGR_SAMPLE_ID=MMETSP1437 /ASSEMBLY_ACC=CAM_ASM_001096 /LENGTH=482 /DNA_ID=CAMNT_0043437387 /DNA_START=23 /DNA_END=1471 /DNA_ORIENTATION=+
MKISANAALVLSCLVGSSAAFAPSNKNAAHSTSLYSTNKSGSKGTGEGWLARPSAPVNSEASAKLTLKKTMEGSSFQKRLSLLGSTGSIGTQTLEIVDACPDNFIVDALSAGNNSELMAEQVMKYKPKVASMYTPEAAADLKERLIAFGCQQMPEILHGDDGILAAATIDSADTVVTGIVGAAGLKPTIEAIKLKKDIALANKETLISGGPVINPLVEEYGVNLLPADSEHSAIFQCLQGVPEGGLRRVILTASGGAFRDLSKQELFDMCENDPRAVQAKATTHPNWDMGAKITLDSATMMNKGLEVIEAHYLFGASYDDIDVVIHPQSIVHSMVETQDTSCLAQLGWADMRLPLVYSVSWPHRLKMPYRPLDLAELSTLTFTKPDTSKYPCIGLAYEAGRAGGTMTAVLNAANEAANEKFREDVGLGFLDIPKLIEGAMEAHKEDLKTSDITLDDILSCDAWAREYVETAMAKDSEKILFV